MEIDVDSLREDLINYFGTAMQFNQLAIMDLTKVENASIEELLKIAQVNGFNLSDYEIKSFRL